MSNIDNIYWAFKLVKEFLGFKEKPVLIPYTPEIQALIDDYRTNHKHWVITSRACKWATWVNEITLKARDNVGIVLEVPHFGRDEGASEDEDRFSVTAEWLDPKCGSAEITHAEALVFYDIYHLYRQEQQDIRNLYLKKDYENFQNIVKERLAVLPVQPIYEVKNVEPV